MPLAARNLKGERMEPFRVARLEMDIRVDGLSVGSADGLISAGCVRCVLDVMSEVVEDWVTARDAVPHVSGCAFV